MIDAKAKERRSWQVNQLAIARRKETVIMGLRATICQVSAETGVTHRSNRTSPFRAAFPVMYCPLNAHVAIQGSSFLQVKCGRTSFTPYSIPNSSRSVLTRNGSGKSGTLPGQ